MSGQVPGGAVPPGPRSASHGPPSAGMAMPPQQTPPQPVNPPTASGGSTGTAGGGSISQQNLNSIVIEYLSKKGYSRTEAMLRMESANQDSDGRPIYSRVEDSGGEKYLRAFGLTKTWIDDNLEIYKPELKRLLWPLFVYSFLNLAGDFYPKDCERFFVAFKDMFAREHADDLRALSAIRLPEHVQSNEIAKIYRGNKYRLTLSSIAYYNLVQFLESKEKDGGAVIVHLLQNHFNIVSVDRSVTGDGRGSLASVLRKAQEEGDMPAEDEGIPGHNPGSANTDRNAPAVLPRLKLGQMPMEQELMQDVQAELEEEDVKNPPAEGQNTLVQEFEKQIKREESEEAPTRDDIPYPPSVARDVAMEVQRIKEHRDRFRIDGRTGGVGTGVSVTMFTFHNTHDSINCLDFSQDNTLVAAGMEESYIRVWNLEGKPITSNLPSSSKHGGMSHQQQPSSSRRLIGHSGPVYAVSFSPCIANPDPNGPSTAARYLLSCSADKTIRLWSLDTWTNLVVYKGHDHPVWDLKWGPFGHYFLTGAHDKTARLWSTDHISCLRIFVGHDQDVDTVAFHPNSAYVFTGSSDKTVRMWAVTTGNPVRLFTGHVGNLTALACSPNGKTLASADDAGAIIIWDLATGRRVKRMRGHGKGGIWSLSWSVESTILVSGGADCTVRVWDVTTPTDGAQTSTTTAASAIVAGPGGTGTGTGTDAASSSSNAPGSATAASSTQAGGGAGGGKSSGEPSAADKPDGQQAGAGITSEKASSGAPGGASTSSSTSAAAAGGGSGAAGGTSSATTGAGGAGPSAPGAKKKSGKEVVITPDQISAFPTKKSPVYRVQFTRQNLVIAGGAYMP
ncbi:WD40 repeat-like protein [Xylona heveae TC161]|uniref:WD40 repeat-like protein n=1 Tax=Xylona heveae (strain CBS 132557 / TC161) TaxID=1328760 RepID=A0A161TG07_XYLHT|nr:WD40 repeat-like protein [Xylona heveae TC161]KZF25027.1 WD40 repeat-like protein [Xylona heveae TC161]